VALALSRTKYAAGDVKQNNIGGQYDFGMAKLQGQYTRDENEALGAKGKGWLLGALVPGGAGEIRAAYSRYEPTSKKLALGYVHNLSKRTAVYATFARVNNDGGAASMLNGATGPANSNSTGYDFGIRHSF
jgi:predicted porin